MADEKSKKESKERPPVDPVLAKRLKNLVPYQFKPGHSGNPNGRRKGQRDYRTLFWIALEHIANATNLTPEQVEEAMHAAGITKAIKGDFFFYQEIANRIYGKPMERMDLTSGGKTLADLLGQVKNGRGRPKTTRADKK